MKIVYFSLTIFEVICDEIKHFTFDTFLLMNAEITSIRTNENICI
jgi:hypothetical protein